MLPSYRTLTTPAFERDTRKILRRNARFLGMLEKMLTALKNDPHNRSRKHDIKKLAALKSGGTVAYPRRGLPPPLRYLWPRCRFICPTAPKRSLLKHGHQVPCFSCRIQMCRVLPFPNFILENVRLVCRIMTGLAWTPPLQQLHILCR